MAHIEQFLSGLVPTDEKDLPSFLQQLFTKLEDYLRQQSQENPLLELHVAPDKPHGGMMVIADGVDWNPGNGRGVYWYDEDVSAWQYLPQLSVDDINVKTSTTTVTNTTTETEIYTHTFPANSFNAAAVLRMDVLGAYTNASGSDDWTLRVKLNGTTIQTLNRAGGNKTDAGWDLTHSFTVRSIGASGTYVHHAMLIDDGDAYAESDIVVHAFDTTAANTMSVTVEWDKAKSGNVFNAMQGYHVEIH